MKNGSLLLLAAFFLVASTAGAKEEEGDFLLGFLQGTYEVVGRWPDSGETYTGRIVVESEGDHLRVLRKVGGEEIEAVGRIETALGGEIKVLRIEFARGEHEYEGTFLIDSDLDNYARLTGHVYLEGGGTEKPGLEAWFIEQQ